MIEWEVKKNVDGLPECPSYSIEVEGGEMHAKFVLK